MAARRCKQGDACAGGEIAASATIGAARMIDALYYRTTSAAGTCKCTWNDVVAAHRQLACALVRVPDEKLYRRLGIIREIEREYDGAGRVTRKAGVRSEMLSAELGIDELPDAGPVGRRLRPGERCGSA